MFLIPTAYGDDTLPEVTTIVTDGGDDVSYQIPLTVSVVYDGVTYENVYATTNSVITFGRADGTYWTYPSTPSISIESKDWWVLPQQMPDTHFIINVSEGGFQVDGNYRPYGTFTGDTTSIVITAQIQTDGTVAYSYAVSGPLAGNERTGAVLTDGTVVPLEEVNIIQVEEPPVLEPTPVEPTPEPEPVEPEPVEPEPVVPEPTPVEPEPVPEEPVIVPEPQPVPQPQPEVLPEPLPVEEPVEPEPVVPEPTPVEPEPVPEEPVIVPEPQPVPQPQPEILPEPLPVEEPVEPEPEVLPTPEPEPEPELEPVPLEPEPLPEPIQPKPPLEETTEEPMVTLDNGVVLTKTQAVAVALLQDPGALLKELFTDPAAVFAALGSVGADMTEEEREQSEKVIIAAVIAGNIATTASISSAAGAAYRRKP